MNEKDSVPEGPTCPYPVVATASMLEDGTPVGQATMVVRMGDQNHTQLSPILLYPSLESAIRDAANQMYTYGGSEVNLQYKHPQTLMLEVWQLHRVAMLQRQDSESWTTKLRRFLGDARLQRKVVPPPPPPATTPVELR